VSRPDAIGVTAAIVGLVERTPAAIRFIAPSQAQQHVLGLHASQPDDDLGY
jgi:hypothetical protein